jgi:hypothetical protein
LAADLSEADLQRKVEHGSARIQRVVVVTIAATGHYVFYVRLDSQYFRVAKRKYDGAKTYRDFALLQRSLAEHGFSGPIFVYPENHPALARLGIP